MALLTAAVVAVGALAALNLVLTLGVVRRLREHGDRLGRLAAINPGGPGDLILAAGERPGAFSARTVAGEEISLASLVSPALVGFFSPGCPPCREWIPRFARSAAELPRGRAQALAVVVSPTGQADAEVSALRDAARVVVEPDGGPVSTAFAVRGFPALCWLGEDGMVLTTDSEHVLTAPYPA